MLFTIPTKVYFGENIIEEAFTTERNLLPKVIMVVSTGGSIIRNGYTERVKEAIRKGRADADIVEYHKICANPDLEQVQEAVSIGKRKDVKLVVGLGGGSAMDAAKAIAVGIGSEEPVETYLLKGEEPGDTTLPIIAIPTTSGTGSELSKAAIISSKRHHLKSGIRGENVIPQVAVVDHTLTWSIPYQVTIETGFDVLAHAIESYMAVKANRLSEILSEEAIAVVAENLPTLINDLDNHQARHNMSYASTLMGCNLLHIGTCLPHRMQYVIGVETGTSHGAGLLALYPAWLEQEYSVNQDKVKKVIMLLTGQKVGTSQEARLEMERFLERLGQRKSLKDLGIQKDKIRELSGKVTGNIANDKLSVDDTVIETIMTNAY